MAYKIVRSFFKGDRRRRVIATGLTLEEAQQHCKNPETANGPWFDGYEECRR